MSDVFAAEADPGIGHNVAPELPTIDRIVADLETANQDALDRVLEIQTKARKYFHITSDAEDDAATQFMVAVRERWKASEAERVKEKTVWDDRAGAVQAFFKRRILDPLGLGPSNPKESFDPVTADSYGVGPRINMAQTIYKREKAEKERKRLEAEAAERRRVEEEERRKREAEERAKRAEEDRIRREAFLKAEAERKVAEEAAAAAARKRNAENKAEAERLAAEARAKADAARESQRLEDERIARERAERDEQQRQKENRLAEERAAAEAAAAVPLADLSRARGEKGGTSSLHSFVNWRDIDREKLDYAALGPYFKDAAIETALKAYADANKATVNNGIKTNNQPIRGVTFFLDARSRGRA